ARKLRDAKIFGEKTTIRIKRHRFPFLKNDDDFLALVKVGRLINTIAFGLQNIVDYGDLKSPVERRQYYRAFFISGGYLHEGIQLAASLRQKYRTEEFFQPLMSLAYDDQYSVQRKILQRIRDSVAFHLDHHDKSTKTALSKLKLSKYDLMSGETDTFSDFYFDFADTVDLNFLIDEFKGTKS